MGKGQLKERCGLETRNNFFPFKKSPQTVYRLDLRIYGIYMQHFFKPKSVEEMTENISQTIS